MRPFNYSEIKNQKWDSDILALIAEIYKEAGNVSETASGGIRETC